MMLKKIVIGVLATLTLASTAYAGQCSDPLSIKKTASGYEAPGLDGKSVPVSVYPEVDADKLKSLAFTQARLQDKDSNNAKVICRYEGNEDLGASLGLPTGNPVQGVGSNWKGDDCAADATAKCSFKSS